MSFDFAGSFGFAELSRRFHNLLVIGKITEVDHEQKAFKALIDENQTDWLSWPADIGKHYIAWRPLRVGTQALFACPEGDIEQAILIQFLHSQDLPPPVTDETVDIIQFNDGTRLEYNSEQQQITVLSTGNIHIQAQGEIHINALGEICSIESAGDLTMTVGGNLSIEVSGSHSLNASDHAIAGPVTQTGGDITSDGISVQNHAHDKVKAGTDMSGKPQ